METQKRNSIERQQASVALDKLIKFRKAAYDKEKRERSISVTLLEKYSKNTLGEKAWKFLRESVAKHGTKDEDAFTKQRWSFYSTFLHHIHTYYKEVQTTQEQPKRKLIVDAKKGAVSPFASDLAFNVAPNIPDYDSQWRPSEGSVQPLADESSADKASLAERTNRAVTVPETTNKDANGFEVTSMRIQDEFSQGGGDSGEVAAVSNTDVDDLEDVKAFIASKGLNTSLGFSSLSGGGEKQKHTSSPASRGGRTSGGGRGSRSGRSRKRNKANDDRNSESDRDDTIDEDNLCSPDNVDYSSDTSYDDHRKTASWPGYNRIMLLIQDTDLEQRDPSYTEEFNFIFSDVSTVETEFVVHSAPLTVAKRDGSGGAFVRCIYTDSKTDKRMPGLAIYAADKSKRFVPVFYSKENGEIQLRHVQPSSLVGVTSRTGSSSTSSAGKVKTDKVATDKERSTRSSASGSSSSAAVASSSLSSSAAVASTAPRSSQFAAGGASQLSSPADASKDTTSSQTQVLRLAA